MKRIRMHGFGWLAAAGLCLALTAGCRTTRGPDRDSVASVLVPNHTLLEAAHAVSEVFEKAGYQVIPQGKSDDFRLVFEEPGRGMDTVLYGGWHPNEVWYRFKIRFRTSSDSVLVTGDVFRVTNHGQGGFEQEQALSHSGGARCQALLEQAAARLK